MRTETDTLADTLDFTRKLTNMYLHHLGDTDPLAVATIGDQKPLNSVLWICAHLTWAEWAMIGGPMAGDPMPFPWMSDFGVGSSSVVQTQWPSIDDVVDAMNDVHVRSLEIIRGLTDLDSNSTMAGVPWTMPRRKFIEHCIRHEGCHAGHLGLWCKIHGIKII